MDTRTEVIEVKADPEQAKHLAIIYDVMAGARKKEDLKSVIEYINLLAGSCSPHGIKMLKSQVNA